MYAIRSYYGFLDYYKNARDLNVQMHEPRNARGNDRGSYNFV